MLLLLTITTTAILIAGLHSRHYANITFNTQNTSMKIETIISLTDKEIEAQKFTACLITKPINDGCEIQV